MHISNKTKKNMWHNILKIKVTHETLGYCITDWKKFSRGHKNQVIALYRKKLMEDCIYALLNPEHPIKYTKRSYKSRLAPTPPPPDAYDPNKEQP